MIISFFFSSLRCDAVTFAERGSKEFERFVSILGNKIRLKGWDKYRGGLDVKGNLRCGRAWGGAQGMISIDNFTCCGR